MNGFFHSGMRMLIIQIIIQIHVCFSLLMAFEQNTGPKGQNIQEQYLKVADSLFQVEQYNEALEYLKKIFENSSPDDFELQASLLYKIGLCESYLGKDIEAIEYYRQVRKMPGQINDPILTGDIYNSMGISYEYTGKPDSAFFYYEKSLQIREELNDTNRLSASYRNMAQILRVMRKLEEATLYCRKAYHLSSGIDDYKVKANIFNELAYLYELGDRLDSAKYYYNQLIAISRLHHYNRGLSVGYSNLASVYEREGNYPEALSLKKKGLNIDKQTHNMYGMMISYRLISESYILRTQYKKALLYLDSAAYLCDTSWVADLKGIENLKYKAYKALGDYQEALVHYENEMVIKDSLFNERQRKNIAEILTKYETEKKEQQIEILDKTNLLKSQNIYHQRIILLGIIFLSFSGAIISFLIIKNQNHKIKQKNLELRNYVLQHADNNHIKKENGEETLDSLFSLITYFGLTQREAEIMKLIGLGLTNDQLAKKLFVSRNTIKYHIKNIYGKLDVKNRVQALQKAALNSH